MSLDQKARLAGAAQVGMAAALSVLVFALIMMVIFGVAEVRQTATETQRIARAIETQQDANTRELALVERTARRIEDCTTAGRTCFREAQERTAEAVNGINEGTLRIIVAAITCADRGLTGSALSRCTITLAGKSR